MALAVDVSPYAPRVRDGFVIPDGELWVFGYGSLMWEPGFEFEAAAPALLRGYHRAFCIYSTRNRGTEQQPGLVLGLNRGGACRGMVYRVAASHVNATLDALWLREMGRHTYIPRALPVTIATRPSSESNTPPKRTRMHALMSSDGSAWSALINSAIA